VLANYNSLTRVDSIQHLTYLRDRAGYAPCRGLHCPSDVTCQPLNARTTTEGGVQSERTSPRAGQWREKVLPRTRGFEERSAVRRGAAVRTRGKLRWRWGGI
jgi:hypothetical protein